MRMISRRDAIGVGLASGAALAAGISPRAVAADDAPAAPKGPPPRFITVVSVDLAKERILFDVQILAMHPGVRPGYVHPAAGFAVRVGAGEWRSVDGKAIAAEVAAKQLRVGETVLLTADGVAVDPAYLRLFRDGVLVLVLPAGELPPLGSLGGGSTTELLTLPGSRLTPTAR